MNRLLFIQTKAPHGTLFGQEVLDAVLMGSAFSTCSVLLLGDGIFQVLRGQDTTALGTKDYSVTYLALKDYGVERICCRERDLAERGLTTADLLLPVDALNDAAVRELMAQHTAIIG